MRLGEEKKIDSKKIETTGQKYNGLPYYITAAIKSKPKSKENLNHCQNCSHVCAYHIALNSSDNLVLSIIVITQMLSTVRQWDTYSLK